MNRILLLIFLVITAAASALAQEWHTFANKDSLYNIDTIHVSATVMALCSDGNNIYVGGDFERTGNVQLNGIARWNGAGWVAVSVGIAEKNIRVIEKFRNLIFVGGTFSSINNAPNSEGLGWYNGGGWFQMHGYTGYEFGSVWAMKSFHDSLIIAGEKSVSPYFYTAAYDGAQVSDYGYFFPNASQFEILYDELYATMSNKLYKRAGNSWINIGYTNNLNSPIIMTVDTFNNFIYIGGSFNKINDVLTSHYTAIWNGYYWESTGINSIGSYSIQEMEYYHGRLYVSALSTLDYNIHLYSNGQLGWQPINDSLAMNWIFTMKEHQDTLWLGGVPKKVNGINIGTLSRFYMPIVGCDYLEPRAFISNDTLCLENGEATGQFFSNNTYADSWLWDFGDGCYSTEMNPFHTYTDTGTFSVTVTVTHGTCVKLRRNSVIVMVCTGSNNIVADKYNLNVFPNPVTENSWIECTVPATENAEIKLYNTSGSLIKTYKLHEGLNRIKAEPEISNGSCGFCCLYINGRAAKVIKIANP